MKINVDCNIPAGNIMVEKIEGSHVYLRQDLRDTPSGWFYWKFRVIFHENGKYTFSFTGGGYTIGARGPAFSTDNGKTWDWLGMDCVTRQPDTFVYEYKGKPGGEVIFCMGIPYLQENFDRFLAAKKGNPYIEKGVLCKSPKGRDVELVRISDHDSSKPKMKLLFTSRHHCCEMMATYALEGILDVASEDSDFGKAFRAAFNVFSVPFADKDGVEDGDQGKNRQPHDHARDYWDTPIYPETKAVMELIRKEKISFVLDLHCPWILNISQGDTNENIYFVGQRKPEMAEQSMKIGDIIERNTPKSVPFFSSGMIPYGFGWNGPGNYSPTTGFTLAKWSADQEFMSFAGSMEIPYANAGEVTLYPDSARQFGRAIARSILEYYTAK